jgi:glucosamine--fructose-6-phosphate aminotransferase (isomerizing)
MWMGAAAAAAYTIDSRRSKCCGIVGYIGKRPIADSVLFEGLLELSNRGYDSAGMATISQAGDLRITKFASDSVKVADCFDKLKASLPTHSSSYVGIAHTRWATHGGKTDNNAHPHTDHKGRIALIHNGTLTNDQEIRAFLKEADIPIRTETDTELIALLIGFFLDEGHSLDSAIESALSRLEGTWGIVLTSKEHPDKIVAARKGSPLVIGVGEDAIFVGSELTAFANRVERYFFLDDNEMVVLSLKNVKEIARTRMKKIIERQEISNLGRYPHWTIKEISEQPVALARAINFGARLTTDSARLRGLDEIEKELRAVENLMILGCGTSYHAAMFGQHIMRRLRTHSTVTAFDPAEFTPTDLPVNKPGIIGISQSGETRDLIRTIEYLQEKQVPCISLVNAVATHLARLTGHGVYLNAGRERAVASTKSFMNSCVVLAAIAIWFNKEKHPEDSQLREEIVTSMKELPTIAGSVITATKHQMRTIAEELTNARHMFVLGRGLGEAIAKEGALKIKEITYVHAEGIAVGELIHGPMMVINESTPVILLMNDPSDASVMNSSLDLLHSKGAKTIVITSDRTMIQHPEAVNHIVDIMPCGLFSSLLSVIPMQLLAYYLSIARGYNPDTPRNLAKVVTVS